MKHTFFLLLLAGFYSCNGQSKQSIAPAGEATPAAGSGTNGTAAGGCSQLVLFHKGAIIEGTTYDSTGKEISKQTTTVTDVSSDNGVLTSTVTMAMNAKTGSGMKITYKCDGNNLYVDMGSLFSNFGAMKDAKVESKPMAFPVNMKEGQVLPDADITVTMPRAGINMKVMSHVSDRKVLGRENITTPAGSWNCYKVTSTVESKTDMELTGDAAKKMGDMMKNRNGTINKYTAVMWFAPGFGIVRTDMYYNSDHPATRSDVTSVKM